MSAKRIIKNIRTGDLPSDEIFDSQFPDWVRKTSTVHWTPVKVAYKAAKLLCRRKGSLILDAGSGSGKFCLVGALATDSSFLGIEQRDVLTSVATEVAAKFELSNAEFKSGSIFDLDWSLFTGVYLYNPFFELVEKDKRIDDYIKNIDETFDECVERCKDKLATLRTGTQVVTYYGFGGKMPDNFSLLHEELHNGGQLQLWKKRY